MDIIDTRPPAATLDVPVLIVGAGPAGLVTAIGLARHGVRSLVIERHPSTSIFPRATGVSTALDGDLPRVGHRRRGPPRWLAGQAASGRPSTTPRRSRRPSSRRSASPTRRPARRSARRPRRSARRTTSSPSSSSTTARSGWARSASRPSSSRSTRTRPGVTATIRDRTTGDDRDRRAHATSSAPTATAAPSATSPASRWKAPTTSAST